ncbi:hypothetical protein BV898_06552 [Hypsibius exemplaris]|uniref:Integrase catalytic domain-containing protein n=1 Tax=Hypsibius exemplaris TaxID=2072580 RepID=A0A1W0WW68_HYPEX|nr:hypothetical protein BV898_06552 [Hypsibius exemplaris]
MNLLNKYLDARNPGSFGGIDRFFESVKGDVADKKQAQQLLGQLDPYSINKENRKQFPRNRVVLSNMTQQFQIDLANFRRYKDGNKGVQYLMFAIDCFSEKASVQLLLTKSADHVKKALQKVFNEMGEPKRIQVDKAKEFFNSTEPKDLINVINNQVPLLEEVTLTNRISSSRTTETPAVTFYMTESSSPILRLKVASPLIMLTFPPGSETLKAMLEL